MTNITSRFNRLLLLLVALMAAAIITMLATGAYGGPLDPTGAPASTDGIRGPGTPISSLPFPINAPGYYYVTRSLTGGPAQHGITINVSNVTVDLGGFTIGGGAGPGNGIYVPGGPRNIVIRNGALRAWDRAIFAPNTTDSRIDNVQASSNSGGIVIGAHSQISDCNASLNTGIGIAAVSSSIRNCTVSENGQDGIFASESLIEGNKVQNNPGAGIELFGDRDTLRTNELSSNGTDLTIGSSTTGNVIAENVYCSLNSSGIQQFVDNVIRC